MKFPNSGSRHILVEAIDGHGIYFMIDETGSRLGCIDQYSGIFVDSGNDLTKYRKGWHHFAITCDNSKDQGIVTFYIDGKPTREGLSLNCSNPIGFIGNSR